MPWEDMHVKHDTTTKQRVKSINTEISSESRLEAQLLFLRTGDACGCEPISAVELFHIGGTCRDGLAGQVICRHGRGQGSGLPDCLNGGWARAKAGTSAGVRVGVRG